MIPDFEDRTDQLEIIRKIIKFRSEKLSNYEWNIRVTEICRDHRLDHESWMKAHKMAREFEAEQTT